MILIFPWDPKSVSKNDWETAKAHFVRQIYWVQLVLQEKLIIGYVHNDWFQRDVFA